MATISMSTGGCSDARVISQLAVAVRATPDATDAVPRAVPVRSPQRGGSSGAVSAGVVSAGVAV